MKEITMERAVEILDPERRELFKANLDAVNEACRMGMEALKKQIPAKPGRARSGAPLCPCCDRFLNRHEQSHGRIDIPFCKWCGQAIDWEAANG